MALFFARKTFNKYFSIKQILDVLATSILTWKHSIPWYCCSYTIESISVCIWLCFSLENSFLKHISIVFKLNKHTWKNKYKTVFWYKKLTPKLVVLHSWKKIQVLEKNFVLKKKSSSLFVQIKCAESINF